MSARGTRAPPVGRAAVRLPGTVYFAGESVVWGGGRAFYDPDLPGDTAACAYLVTAEQFDDIHGQEPSCYDRVLDLGHARGSDADVHGGGGSRRRRCATARRPPYLDTMATDFAEVFGWNSERAQAYLRRLR
ncbi:hypothetical protein GS432_08930, partial [Rhodococcus hoagii]|nr:hypothetical protein [Prescottella equi]